MDFVLSFHNDKNFEFSLTLPLTFKSLAIGVRYSRRLYYPHAVRVIYSVQNFSGSSYQPCYPLYQFAQRTLSVLN